MSASSLLLCTVAVALAITFGSSDLACNNRGIQVCACESGFEGASCEIDAAMFSSLRNESKSDQSCLAEELPMPTTSWMVSLDSSALHFGGLVSAQSSCTARSSLQNSSLIVDTSYGRLPVSSAPCSGRGEASCQCHFGFVGPTCYSPVDFCASAPAGLGPVVQTTAELCGRHGRCLNAEGVGATCDCDEGWEGARCDIPVSGQMSLITRCYSFEPTEFELEHGVSVGCTDDRRCVTDDLNCLLSSQPCEYPIGWCLPKPISDN